jgi:hypothetical protein
LPMPDLAWQTRSMPRIDCGMHSCCTVLREMGMSGRAVAMRSRRAARLTLGRVLEAEVSDGTEQLGLEEEVAEAGRVNAGVGSLWERRGRNAATRGKEEEGKGRRKDAVDGVGGAARRDKMEQEQCAVAVDRRTVRRCGLQPCWHLRRASYQPSCLFDIRRGSTMIDKLRQLDKVRAGLASRGHCVRGARLPGCLAARSSASRCPPRASATVRGWSHGRSCAPGLASACTAPRADASPAARFGLPIQTLGVKAPSCTCTVQARKGAADDAAAACRRAARGAPCTARTRCDTDEVRQRGTGDAGCGEN